MKTKSIICTLGLNTNRRSHPVAYNQLEHALDSVGFDVHFFDPAWEVPEPNYWAEGMAASAARRIEAGDTRPVIFGFSAGAVVSTLATALLERQNKPIAGMVACSISSWFGPEQVDQTLQTPNTSLGEQSEELIDACRQLTLPEINAPIQLYIGGKEHSLLKNAHEDARTKWRHAESIVAPGAGHNILDPVYLDTVMCNIGRLAIG